ncbi:hypothetical protein, partial [Protofrankia sp. BMG5.30]|uniref:hypothetical protein n=1 Tax=Protofrankia sp. BMG5.30 TaxID=1834514 RepID=UPI001C37AF26
TSGTSHAPAFRTGLKPADDLADGRVDGRAAPAFRTGLKPEHHVRAGVGDVVPLQLSVPD